MYKHICVLKDMGVIALDMIVELPGRLMKGGLLFNYIF